MGKLLLAKIVRSERQPTVICPDLTACCVVVTNVYYDLYLNHFLIKRKHFKYYNQKQNPIYSLK